MAYVPPDHEAEEFARDVYVPPEETVTEERFREWVERNIRVRRFVPELGRTEVTTPTERQIETLWRGHELLQEKWAKYGIRPIKVTWPWGTTKRFAISGMRGLFGPVSAERIRRERAGA